MRRGNPIRSAWAQASASVSTGPPLQGATGIWERSARRLAAILSPKLAHHISRGPDVYDPHFPAKVGECRVFRHKAPSNPHGIGADGGERVFQSRIVEVAALWPLSFRVGEMGGAETECLVRLTRQT